MSDMYELLVTLTLSPAIPDDELAELRWHLGQGPKPDALPLTGGAPGPAFPLGDPEDPDSEWDTDPEPMFAHRGAGWKLPGALVADLVERDGRPGWALTLRQEIHPDEFPAIRALLRRVARHGESIGFAGFVRFYEDHAVQPLLAEPGRIELPAALLD
ncbi:MAG TPA: hypothetical protein VL738_38265 [Dactylosporangium sp.]|jgi:hypothetical protein|nr:hypothetical protein [Dactylosporangium sp.]